MMKRLSGILAVAALVFTAFFIASMLSPDHGKCSPRKKDQNCVNRCNVEKNLCFKKVRKYKYKERIAAENNCIRERNTCSNLCSEVLDLSN